MVKIGMFAIALKVGSMKTMVAAVCVVAAGMGGFNAYNKSL